jgi:hypothetical protein
MFLTMLTPHDDDDEKYPNSKENSTSHDDNNTSLVSGSAESTMTAGGTYGVFKDAKGQIIQFMCKIKGCGCEYVGSLFYNNGTNVSGRGTGVKCGHAKAKTTTRAVTGPFYVDGKLYARDEAELETKHPKPPKK